MRRWIAVNGVIVGAASLVAADERWWAYPAAAALMALNGITYMRKTNDR